MIIRCTLARIQVNGWIIQCSEHSGTKACSPILSRLFQFHLEQKWGSDVQIRHNITRTVEDRGYVTIEC